MSQQQIIEVVPWVCERCKGVVTLQVQLANPNNSASLDDLQVCISYECTNCGSEAMSYNDPYGGNSP